ncbi:MAG TPA: GMC family oxidoreductase [Dehalococcoidia bacterium]|nr:GMC family oxidoreductase [Dehalococcoidia bacterium]
MLIDANALPDGATLSADVCIIGAGPAGITVARELAGARLRVCLLESGGLDADDGAQDLAGGEIDGDWQQPLRDTRRRRVGGTAHGWAERIGFRKPGGRFLPLSPLDFERRDWLPHSGWPFGVETLLPYYRRAQRVCRIGPFAYDGRAWQTPKTPASPLPEATIETRVFQIGRRSVFTSSYRDELVAHQFATLYQHATVLELQTNDAGTAVERASVAAGNGRRFTVAARTFVLALGGIENARLLLLSRRRHAAGLGNGHDLVGRFLMEHPQVRSGLLVPFAAQTLRHAGLYDVHHAFGTPVMGHLAPSEAARQRDALPNLGMMLFPVPRPAAIAATAAAWRVLRRPRLLLRGDARACLWTARQAGADLAPPLLRLLTRPQPLLPALGWGGWSAGPFGGRGFVAYDTLCLTEQAPCPESRVTLAATRDSLGQPRARVEWRWREADRERVRRVLDLFAGECASAGIGYFRPSPDQVPPTLSHHHLGATRMHASPRCGVVDADCRVHDLANLYVAGSSVFPTGGYASPTLSVIALALRLADRVRAGHRGTVTMPIAAAASRQGVLVP